MFGLLKAPGFLAVWSKCKQIIIIILYIEKCDFYKLKRAPICLKSFQLIINLLDLRYFTHIRPEK